MKAIDLFNQWAINGKDDGMERNHSCSVDFMWNLIPDSLLSNDFTFLDIGCGNGWLVHRVSKLPNCKLSSGIDGAKNMINKAKLKDSKSRYIMLDLNHLQDYHASFDIVFSMEVFYYLNNPKEVIQHVWNNNLNKGGCFILGIDHYMENQLSLSWPKDLDVTMKTHTILQWKDMFMQAGFINISSFFVGKKKNWNGTLVLYGEK